MWFQRYEFLKDPPLHFMGEAILPRAEVPRDLDIVCYVITARSMGGEARHHCSEYGGGGEALGILYNQTFFCSGLEHLFFIR